MLVIYSPVPHLDGRVSMKSKFIQASTKQDFILSKMFPPSITTLSPQYNCRLDSTHVNKVKSYTHVKWDVCSKPREHSNVSWTLTSNGRGIQTMSPSQR